MTITPRWPSASGSLSFMASAARRSTLNVPIRFTSTTRRKASSGHGPSRPTMRWICMIPAQTTAPRSGPKRSRAVAIARRISASSVTSAGQKRKRPPHSATSASEGGRTSAITPQRPAPASRRTHASPSPELPPATRNDCRSRVSSVMGYAVWINATSWSPSSSMACWRILYFWILPVTVIGKLLTNLT